MRRYKLQTNTIEHDNIVTDLSSRYINENVGDENAKDRIRNLERRVSTAEKLNETATASII
jgi:hypothetical protein